MAAKPNHMEMSSEKPSWWLPIMGEVFRAAKRPQDFSAWLHPRSSLLLQRVAADFRLKLWAVMVAAEATITPERTPSPPRSLLLFHLPLFIPS